MDTASPVLRSKDEARTNYNRLSRWYDHFADRSEEKYRQTGTQALAAQLGERVLEIGCGTGHGLLGFVLELFDTPEIPQVEQCHRLLRPTGHLAVVALAKNTPPTLGERIYEWFHARLPVLVDCRPIAAQAALHQTGFEITQVISQKMWRLPVEIVLAHKL